MPSGERTSSPTTSCAQCRLKQRDPRDRAAGPDRPRVRRLADRVQPRRDRPRARRRARGERGNAGGAGRRGAGGARTVGDGVATSACSGATGWSAAMRATGATMPRCLVTSLPTWCSPTRPTTSSLTVTFAAPAASSTPSSRWPRARCRQLPLPPSSARRLARWRAGDRVRLHGLAPHGRDADGGACRVHRA